MQRLRRVLCLAIVFALALTGCMKAEPIPPVPGPITQEEVQGNAGYKAAYKRFFDVRSDGPIIPGLRQGLVPQGTEYLPDQDWILISGYRDNDSSLVVIIDAETGEFVKAVSFRLPSGSVYTGHAGGVAASQHHLWIASGEHVHYVSLDELVMARDGAEIQFEGRVRIDARGSFVSYTDGVLWVGDFARPSSHPTEAHHKMTNRQGKQHNGWIAGYLLDAATDLIPTGGPKNAKGAYIPDYVLSIPDIIQGSYILGDYIILTASYGRNNDSHLFIYDNPLSEPPHRTVTVDGVKVPVWFLDNANLADTWILPPMVESVVERQGQIYINFESAALKYLDGRYALSRLQIVYAKDLLP